MSQPQPARIVIKVEFTPGSEEEAELVATDIANAVEEVLKRYGFENRGFSFETHEVELNIPKAMLEAEEAEKDFEGDILSRIKPYPKTALYLSKYCNVTGIPLQARWLVLKYVGLSRGYGMFTEDLNVDGVPALILDDYSNRFWPVVSFLTRREVEQLRKKFEVL